METLTKDIYWLAGLLEGEASFYTYTKYNQKTVTSYPELTFQSTDFDIAYRVSKIVNSNISNVKPYGSSKQNSFKVRACSNKAIQWMITLYSLMGERRQEKIREVINE